MKQIKLVVVVAIMTIAMLVPPSQVFAEKGSRGMSGDKHGGNAIEELREIEHQLDLQAVELEQQKAHAIKLEQQMQCNWVLLKEYEACEQEHEAESTEKRLECNNRAKQEHKKCLDAIQKEVIDLD